MSTSRNIVIISGVTVGLVACGTFIPREGWNPSYGPVVPHDSFPTDCSICHEGGSWTSIKSDFEFDHEKETGVLLVGAHQNVSCLLCHNDRGPVARFAERGCAGCHEDTHRGRLGPNCIDCHNENTWRPIEAIALHSSTRFPLVGAHAAAECFRCHEGAQVGNFEGLDPSCVSCHLDDALQTTAPNHALQGWVDDCQRCHLPVDWNQAQFAHPASFPLAGGHAGQGCQNCHLPNTFTGLATDCASCHLDTFNATTNPNHPTAGFSTDCTQCHSIFGWGGGNFQHTPMFPLTGGHAMPTCLTCHIGGQFAGTDPTCSSCHLDDFNATVNPNHPASGFSTDCTQCHNTTGWVGANFVHTPAFPLNGAHSMVACALCHIGGVFAGTDPACVSCHLDDFNATTNPNHVNSGFSTDCMLCHNTMGWAGANFQHTPAFPLNGGHSMVACALCHIGGVFAGTDPACVSCHLDDFNATNNPNHQQSGFSTDCTQCHNTMGWAGANFQHTPAFPLNGGHSMPVCAACHIGGVFAGTDPSCVSCHLDNFNATNNPNHQQSGFSTDCQVCHDIFNWNNATFNHSFPINGGPHGNNKCIDCHTIPAATPQFSCTNCHTHRKTAMDNKHSGVGGYIWESSACFSCHPNGKK